VDEPFAPEAPVLGRSWTGQVLAGRYELASRIGAGGMATVYDGFDRRLRRPVAVKLLLPHLAGQAPIRSRFEHEARTAARLTHPNIVAVFDTGEARGVPFIVMERLPGTTLADEMRRGPVAAERIREVGRQVLAALALAHAHGVLHRDIKPSNLLLADEGRVKVADFGIAKSAASDDATATGLLVGTLAYLAPERIAGRPATIASDLYAVGVVLHEMSTGFDRASGSTAGTGVTDAPLGMRRLGVLPARTDPDLAATITRALAAEPSERFGDAEQMAAALRGESEPRAEARPAGGEASSAAWPLVESREATAVFEIPAATKVLELAPGGPEGDAPVERPRRRRPFALVAGFGGLALLLAAAFASQNDDPTVRVSTSTVPPTVTTTSAVATAPPASTAPASAGTAPAPAGTAPPATSPPTTAATTTAAAVVTTPPSPPVTAKNKNRGKGHGKGRSD
jgi:serine/threonine-protein kinase